MPDAASVAGVHHGDIDNPRVIRLRPREEVDIAPADNETEILFPQPNGAEEHGIDALAFYLPFHFHRGWGIYVSASGIACVAEVLKGRPLATGDAELTRWALIALCVHEHGHFTCEAVATLGEAMMGRSWYAAYFADPMCRLLEEALCNGKAVAEMPSPARRRARSLAEPEGNAQQRLSDWLSKQPGGREFLEFVPRRAAEAAQRRLFARMRFPGVGLTIGATSQEDQTAQALLMKHDWPTDVLWQMVSAWNVPTYLVIDPPWRCAIKAGKKRGLLEERVLVLTPESSSSSGSTVKGDA